MRAWASRLIALFCVLAGHLAAAQPAFLVKDVKQSETPLAELLSILTNASIFWADTGGILYFAAEDGIHGHELWRSDGTQAGTRMVKDICPGRCSGFGSFAEIASLGGLVLFVANDGVHGRELWRSDGTPDGTILVRDIAAGLLHSTPEWLAVSNGVLFFVIRDHNPGASGGTLWRSDGTAPGTQPVREFSGPGSLSPERLTALGAALVFFASDGLSGGELWRSNGSEAGTELVRDIRPGTESGVSVGGYQPFPVRRELAQLGGRLFFPATDGVHGEELWVTDGTAAGTHLVKDVNTGGSFSDSSPYHLCVAENVIFFRAFVGFAGSTFTIELWKTDGTEAGTVRVSSAAPSFFTQCAANRVFFAAPSASTGHELWISDGTEAGTGLVEDILPGPAGSLDFNFGMGVGAVGDRLLFWAHTDAHGLEPWISDGSAEGTLQLADLASGSLPSAAPNVLHTVPFSTASGAVFFALSTGHGWEPWRTDGTPAGTQLLAETNSQLSSQRKFFDFWSPVGLRDHLGALAFVPEDGFHGSELWRSDGTELGTTLIKDIHPGEQPGTGTPTSLIGKLFFSGTEPDHGREPWVSDLTSAGTLMLADTASGSTSGDPGGFGERNGLVYFSSATKRWETDGTPAGTHVTTEPLAASPAFELPCIFATSVSAAALHRSFFVSQTEENGAELWSKAEPAGSPALVMDIWPGAVGSHPQCLVATPGRVYFVADDGSHGRELWRSDGTADGTFLVKDIVPGAGSSLPEELRVVDGALLFAAWDPVHGRELWASDGTEASTVKIQDLAPGWVSSSPSEFTLSGAHIFFYATDGVRGFELWALPRAELAERVSASLYFHTLTPCRLLDTRESGPVSFSAPLVIDVTGLCGIPDTARAIAGNFTVVHPSTEGTLEVGPYPDDDELATAVAFKAGQVRAGHAVVRLATDGSGRLVIAAPKLEPPNTVHLVIDVTGYFE